MWSTATRRIKSWLRMDAVTPPLRMYGPYSEPWPTKKSRHSAHVTECRDCSAGDEHGPWANGEGLRRDKSARQSKSQSGEGCRARGRRSRLQMMPKWCPGPAPCRLAGGTAPMVTLGADGAVGRERRERQSTSRYANEPTTHTTSPEAATARRRAQIKSP